MRTLKTIPLLLLSLSAFADDYCSIVLETKAFNVEKQKSSQDIVDQVRNDICSKTYSNAGEARSSAKASGLDVGYAGFQLGGSQAKQDGSSSYDIRQSDFCQASSSNFQKKLAEESSKTTTDIALRSWLDCIDKQSVSKAYIQWEPDRTGRSLHGKIHFSKRSGRLDEKIEGIIFQPADFPKDQVKCQIGAKTFLASELEQQPILLDDVETPFACSKLEGSYESKDLKFTFYTSEYLGWMTLYSPDTSETTDVEELERKLQALTKTVTLNKVELTGLINTTDTELTRAIGDILDGNSVVGKTKKLNTIKSSCSWHAIQTHHSFQCPGNQFVASVCLTNKDKGCPNGQPGGSDNTWVTAGAVKCCSLY